MKRLMDTGCAHDLVGPRVVEKLDTKNELRSHDFCDGELKHTVCYEKVPLDWKGMRRQRTLDAGRTAH